MSTWMIRLGQQEEHEPVYFIDLINLISDVSLFMCLTCNDTHINTSIKVNKYMCSI